MTRLNVGNIRHPDGTDDNINLDSSGRVGIGTASPSTKLQVDGSWVSNYGTLNIAGPDNDLMGVGFRNTSTYLGGVFFRDGAAGDFLELNAQGSRAIRALTNGTERARIDSSGRLLVGTSTARTNINNESWSGNVALNVEGANAFGTAVNIVNNYNGNGYSFLNFLKSNTTSVGSNTIVSNGNTLGLITFQGNDGTEFVQAARIACEVEGTPGANDMPGRLVFSTTADGASSPTQRMIIASNGTVGIGQPNNNLVRLALTGQTSDNTAYTFAYYNTFGTTLHYTRNDGVLCTGLASGSPYNLTTGAGANVHVDGNGILYRSTSSIRFKTNIESLEDSYADAILNIEPVWYRSTAPGDEVHPDWSYYGFIAEDVAKIDPRLVFWKTHEAGQDEEGKPTFTALDEPIAEGVQYERFVPHLLNLIKRQQQAIETLEAGNADLAARLTALEGGAAQ